MELFGLIILLKKLKRKHNVQQQEVREVLNNDPHFRFVEKVIGQVKMSMQQWGRLIAIAISLYF